MYKEQTMRQGLRDRLGAYWSD